MEAEKARHWRTCAQCEILAPPRSWHCNTCGTCILKRDHHCVFTGYCIGHHNHRYFYMFVFYTFIGNVYSLLYTSAYLWWLHADEYLNVYTFIKMVCPLLGFFSRLSFPCLYLAIYEMNLALLIYTLMILRFHIVNTLKGAVSFDRHTSRYDLGWKQNLLMVFGERWYLIWLSPFIRSELPHDGVHWEMFTEDSTKIF